MKLVIEFEVAGWEYLEDRVAIVFEEEDIVKGLVLDFDISKALRSEESTVDVIRLETLD